MPKPVYEEGEVTVLWNQAVHTEREVTANRPDIIINNKKRENTHTDRCGNTGRQKCCAKGSGNSSSSISSSSNKKLAASSMLHEAKIAYYAFDVIVYCMYTLQTRIAYTKRTH